MVGLGIGIGLTDGGAGGGGGEFTSPASTVFWFSGDNPLNTIETVTENFAPAAVNTGTDKITLATTGYTRTSSQHYGRCYFTTTGTLPSGLALATYYIPENNGDGTYSFWPIATNASYTDFDGYENGEDLVYGLYFQLRKNKINLTDQGSGTHTINFVPTIQHVHDKILDSNLFSKTSRTERFEVLSDEKGTYIALPGATIAHGDAEGKSMSANLSHTQIGAFFDNKRYIYSVSVNRPRVSSWQGKQRVILSPSAVNAGTGVITSSNAPLVTGRAVTRNVLSDGGSFPTPTVPFANPVYVRYSNPNITLHPTSSDATNNLNAYTYSDTGSGTFAISENVSCKEVSSDRKMILDISKQSNDHTFSPMNKDLDAVLNMGSGSVFLTGGFDGWVENIVVGVGATSTIYTCKIFIPSGAVGPTCRDTGTALTSGTYYITHEPTSISRGRFHRTLANAQASVGITTSSLSNTVCLKYSALGSGTCGVWVSSNVFSHRQFDDGFVFHGSITRLNEYEQFGVYVSVVDYNDGSGKWKFYSGLNSINNHMSAATSSYNSPQPSSSVNSSMFLGNTGQPHVSGHVDLYEQFIGTSDTFPTADITTIIDAMKSKYGIVAPVNTEAPVISGTATRGEVLSCTTGIWLNSPTSYTYQWYRSPGTAISGATSATYTLSASDVGLQIFCRVSGVSIAGTGSPVDSNTTTSVADAPFTPVEITNISLWLDASDAASISHSANAVSQLDDKSGNDRHATQGTGANKPTTNTRTIGGLNVLDFDGTGDFLTIPSITSTAYTVFCVFNTDGYAASKGFIGSPTGNNGAMVFGPRFTNGGLAFTSSGVAVRLASTTAISNGIDYIASGRSSAAGSNIQVNGADAGSNATNAGYTAPSSLIGRYLDEYYNGAIGELIVFSRALADPEMNEIGNYLAAKWGLTWADI